MHERDKRSSQSLLGEHPINELYALSESKPKCFSEKYNLSLALSDKDKIINQMFIDSVCIGIKYYDILQFMIQCVCVTVGQISNLCIS